MNADKNIVDDLQVRCITYTLLRKWPTRADESKDVLAYALRAAELLGMAEWQGLQAYAEWVELTFCQG